MRAIIKHTNNDVLDSLVKGLRKTAMINQSARRSYRHIPNCYFDKAITKFISDRIQYDEIRTYDDLNDIDQDKLIALCMNALGHDAFDVIFNSIDTNEIEKTFKEFLNSPGESYSLAEAMRNAAALSIAYDMNNLFAELQREYQF